MCRLRSASIRRFARELSRMMNGRTDSSSEAPKRTIEFTKSSAPSRLRKIWAADPSKRPCAALARRCRAAPARARTGRRDDPPLPWRADDRLFALSGGVICPPSCRAIQGSIFCGLVAWPCDPTSAAAKPALTASARLVGQAIVTKDRPFVARDQLAVGIDRRRILHLLLAVGDPEIPGPDGRPVQGHEHEPVPADHPDP